MVASTKLQNKMKGHFLAASYAGIIIVIIVKTWNCCTNNYSRYCDSRAVKWLLLGCMTIENYGSNICEGDESKNISQVLSHILHWTGSREAGAPSGEHLDSSKTIDDVFLR